MIFLDNQTDDAVLVRYRDDGPTSYYEVEPRSLYYVKGITGGASGVVDVLTLDCNVIDQDIVIERFGQTLIELPVRRPATASVVEGDVASVGAAEQLENDFCELS